MSRVYICGHYCEVCGHEWFNKLPIQHNCSICGTVLPEWVKHQRKIKAISPFDYHKNLECIENRILKRKIKLVLNSFCFRKSVSVKWRKSVYLRDNYTCQKCGNKNNLHAHHILSRKQRPDLINDINNGITLCYICHEKEHGFKIGDKFVSRKLIP